MTSIRFDDRVAIVTGAGGGLGRGYALDLARRGAAVVVNDIGGDIEGRNESHSMADGVVAEIEALGGKAVANYDSVATSSGGRAIVNAALDTFGRVDVVINNAGNLLNANVEDITDELLDSILDVHLKGAFYVTCPAFEQMKQQNYGRIVFTSSAASMLGNPEQAAYAAAKAGLVGAMNVVSLEGEPHNIKANALMPTAMSRMAEAMDPEMMAATEQFFASLGDKLGNSMSPDFVTPLVTFLASEACDSTHAIYSSCMGRYAKAFIGICEGWIGPREAPPSAEDIAEQFAKICDKTNYSELGSLMEEFMLVRSQLTGES